MISLGSRLGRDVKPGVLGHRVGRSLFGETLLPVGTSSRGFLPHQVLVVFLGEDRGLTPSSETPEGRRSVVGRTRSTLNVSE